LYKHSGAVCTAAHTDRECVVARLYKHSGAVCAAAHTGRECVAVLQSEESCHWFESRDPSHSTSAQDDIVSYLLALLALYLATTSLMAPAFRK
jgi:hypothetical protein